MPISEEEFGFVRDFVGTRSSIVLAAGKEYLIESRLKPVARAESFDSVSALIAGLRARPAGPLAQLVIDAMTTNETSFFRDMRPFDAIRFDILPTVMERRSSTRALKIWSAAASTGQEAYSLAITIREHFPELSRWNCQILGTDISHEALGKAAAGRYSQNDIGRGLPTPLLMKYFDRVGAQFEVKPELKSLVEFRPLNLDGALTAVGRPDIVLLRNVLIYFDLETRVRMLRAIAAQMAGDGFLILGGGETIIAMDVPFEKVETEETSYFVPARARARIPVG
jgi:chemotaxis protein methyltransferase CheR